MPGNLQNGVSSSGTVSQMLAVNPLDVHLPVAGTGGASPVRPAALNNAIAAAPSVQAPLSAPCLSGSPSLGGTQYRAADEDDPETVSTMMSCVTPLQGSTPRVWGNLSRHAQRAVSAHGINPTSVGKLVSTFVRQGVFYGINPTSVGKLRLRTRPDTDHVRINPTSVGKLVIFLYAIFCVFGINPTSVGKLHYAPCLVHTAEESTPQVWGNFDYDATGDDVITGSTPQVWGNSRGPSGARSATRDQPNKCGETPTPRG